MQEDIIQSVLSGDDTLALLPTGGGKSICFQVPAMAMDGLCIVISPLIALMKDQVENLKKRGINAVAIYSGQSKREIDILLDNCAYGDVKFLYVSPERLKTELFIARLKKMKVALLAVDEAHCISQWGYDFRPPYLEIAEIRQHIPDVPVIALTATATKQVCDDIIEKLDFKEKIIFQKSFLRSNLSYSVFYTENKNDKLLQILNNVPGTSVVYVRSRNRTKEIAEFLQKNRISADFYHAGLENKVREKKQESWINNKVRVIVSTNAFGMGIDKPDVRTVVHIDLPDNPEAYFQEAGRAGRDEKLAYAVLLYDNGNLENLKKRVEVAHPNVNEIKQVYQALCSYFKIATGGGFMQDYVFDFEQFCTQYNLDKTKTHYCLLKLQNQNLISLSEAYQNSSKAMVIVNQKDLYAFQVAHKDFDEFIKILLRFYGGEMFNNMHNISEKEIAKKANMTEDDTIKTLEKLQKLNIIEYQKLSTKPTLTFLTERYDAQNLPLDLKFLKWQKELDSTKAATMIEYVKNETRCRSLILMEYFNEISDNACGICDYCLRKKKEKRSSELFKLIRAEIIKVLENNPENLKNLVKLIPSYREKDISEVVKEMLDSNELHLDENQDLYLM